MGRVGQRISRVAPGCGRSAAGVSFSIADVTQLRQVIAMDSFALLERSALNAILDETGEDRTIVATQLLHAKVISRENTGGGFFVNIEGSPDAAPLDPRTAPLGQNVYVGVAGLEYGLGAILHCKEGRINLLEGYSVGGEDTSSIDFLHVPFALIAEPGPLPASDG